jgi:UPF0755 protein
MTRLLIIIFLIFGAVFFWLHFSYFDKINNYQLVPLKITIPEGFTCKDIAEKFKVFKNFNQEAFLKTAQEGYLFPDTYFFTGRETEKEVIETMKDNFEKKAGQVKPEILIMASILEKEVKTIEDKKIVAGILWKRLEAGMPLQVDAEPSTYLYKELPGAPICNPGLESISAALNPVDSPYWYYVSDKQGITHFAKTFSEHQKNIAKYLTK